MIDLFYTSQGAKFWKSNLTWLTIYYTNLEVGNYLDAAEIAEKIAEAADVHKAECSELSCDELLNDYFIARVAGDLLRAYSLFWDSVLTGKFSGSWILLQDVQDALCVLFQFGKTTNSRVLKAMERQSGFLEQVYPYSLFFSVEMTHDGLECSICGLSVSDDKCIHLPGRLYRGKIAHGIIRNVRELQAVSLVEHPRDKRCVVKYDDKGKQFRILAHLRKLLSSGPLKALLFDRIDKTTIEKVATKFNASFRNKSCPCGSRIKFKKCCLHKEVVKHPHINFVGVVKPVFTLNDLLGSREVNFATPVALPSQIRE